MGQSRSQDTADGGAQSVSAVEGKRKDRRRELTGWILILDGRDCFGEDDGHAAGVILEIPEWGPRARLTCRDASQCGSAGTLIINGQSESCLQATKVCIQGPGLSVTNLRKYEFGNKQGCTGSTDLKVVLSVVSGPVDTTSRTTCSQNQASAALVEENHVPGYRSCRWSFRRF
jgi:hypothetical protein